MSSPTGNFTAPRNEQNAHNVPMPAVGWYGGALHQHRGRTLAEDRRVASKGLGREITPISPSLQSLTHDTTGLIPARLVFGRELRLPCDLLFGAPSDKERPTTDRAADLVDHLHDIYYYARQHLNLASERMKTRYDKLANCAGYHEGDRVWLYRSTRSKRKSPYLQSPWEASYKIITRINDVVYRIQKTPRSRMMVVPRSARTLSRGWSKRAPSRKERM
jgi:hypothetical protein